MSTQLESQDKRERSWIYVVAVIILGGTLLAALLVFSEVRETTRSQEKADELIAAIEQSGAPAPDREVVIRLFRHAGGPTGDERHGAPRRVTVAALRHSGAAGPGSRPIIADSRLFQGQLLVMEVYCPEELDDFRSWAEDLATDDVLGN